MESMWTVEANGRSFGPFTSDQLVTLAQSGQVQPFHMVRRDGGPPVSFAEVQGLLSAPGAANGSSYGPTQPQYPSSLPPAVQTPMAPGYYAAPNAQPYPAQQYGTPPMAPPHAAPGGVPPTQVRSASATTGGAPAVSSGVTTGRRKSPASNQFIVTSASILIGAAAAVLIYINLEPLEKRIRGSGKGDEAEVAVTPPAPPAPRPVNNLPVATAAPPNTPPSAPPSTPPNNSPTIIGVNVASTDNVTPRAMVVTPVAESVGSPTSATDPTAAVLQSVFDSGRSVVQFRTSGSSQSPAIGSGFAVDDRGTIATALGAYRPGSKLTAFFPDGTRADVIGYVGVAADRDLLFLKISAVATKPLPQAQTGAVAGTRIFVAGAKLGGGSSHFTGDIESTRRLNRSIQASNGTPYLAEGTQIGTLRNRAASVSRGGPVINVRGELVGVLSIAPDGVQSVIDRRHVAELMASAGDVARPLAELDRAGSGTVAAIPAITPGPVQVASQPRTPVVDTSSWVREFDAIYSRRDALIATREQAQSAIKPLLPELTKLELDYKAREPQYLRAKFEYDDNERRIAQLTVSTVNDVPNSLQRNNLAVRLSDRSYLRSNLNYEESRISGVKSEYEGVKKRVEDYNAQLATVSKEAETLRSDFLKLLDPFGVPSKERGAAGVQYFTERIPLEKDNSLAYLGRASAYLLQGENRLAITDLDAAVKVATEKTSFLTVRGVAHARAGDLAQARKDLSDAIRFDDKNSWCRFQYCLILCRTEAFALIEQQLRECMKFEPANPNAFTMMALLKATADDKFRNADYALRMAQSAYDMSTAKSWYTSMALAAAYAEKGDFDQAVQYAEKSVAAAGDRQAAWCRDCLKTFQDKKPLRIDWKTFDLWAML